MAKVSLHPLFKQLRGRIHGLVFRRSHSGETSIYGVPDMSRVKWSQDQVTHRERMAEAYAYASAAIKDPEIRQVYLEMARKIKKNNRPYDMAVSDYFHNRNNLLGDKFHWDVEDWRWTKQFRKKKKR